jgi:hypothetical protein
LAILKGEYEPTDQECDLTGIMDEKDKKPENLDTLVEKMTLVEEPLDSEASSDAAKDVPPLGVPKFWLDVFQNSSVMIASFEDEDIEIFKYLDNVSVDMLKDRMVLFLNIINSLSLF